MSIFDWLLIFLILAKAHALTLGIPSGPSDKSYWPFISSTSNRYKNGLAKHDITASPPLTDVKNTVNRRVSITILGPNDWWLIFEDMVSVPSAGAAASMLELYNYIHNLESYRLQDATPLPALVATFGPWTVKIVSTTPLSLSWIQNTFALTMGRLVGRGLVGEYRVRFENRRTGVMVTVVLGILRGIVPL